MTPPQFPGKVFCFIPTFFQEMRALNVEKARPSQTNFEIKCNLQIIKFLAFKYFNKIFSFQTNQHSFFHNSLRWYFSSVSPQNKQTKSSNDNFVSQHSYEYNLGWIVCLSSRVTISAILSEPNYELKYSFNLDMVVIRK